MARYKKDMQVDAPKVRGGVCGVVSLRTSVFSSSSVSQAPTYILNANEISLDILGCLA